MEPALIQLLRGLDLFEPYQLSGVFGLVYDLVRPAMAKAQSKWLCTDSLCYVLDNFSASFEQKRIVREMNALQTSSLSQRLSDQLRHCFGEPSVLKIEMLDSSVALYEHGQALGCG